MSLDFVRGRETKVFRKKPLINTEAFPALEPCVSHRRVLYILVLP